MDPITGAILKVFEALLQSAIDLAVIDGLRAKVARDQAKKVQEYALMEFSKSSSGKYILEYLAGNIKENVRLDFINEIGKIFFLSEQPDLEKLAKHSGDSLAYWRRVNPTIPYIEHEEIVNRLSDLIENLRNLTLDQSVLGELYTNTEILREMRKSVSIQEQHLEIASRTLKATETIQNSLIDNKISVNLPDAPLHSPRFEGRSQILTNLEDLLNAGKNVAIWGTAGIGKTSLIQKFCLDHKLQYPSVFWADITEDTRPEQILYTWGRYLRENYQLDPNQSTNPKLMADEIRSLLKDFINNHSKGKALFVIDNVWADQIDLIEIIIRAIPLGFPYILTTRQKDVTYALHSEVLKIDFLTDEEVDVILNKNINNVHFDEGHHNLVRNLLDGHPLALNHAIVTLNQAASPTELDTIIQAYQQSIKEGRDIADELDRYFINSSSVFAVLEFSYKALKEKAKFYYRQLGVFPDDSKWNINLLKYLWEDVNHESLMRLFQTQALIEKKDENFYQHPLLKSHALWHLNKLEEFDQTNKYYITSVINMSIDISEELENKLNDLKYWYYAISHIQHVGKMLITYLDRLSHYSELQIEEVSEQELLFVNFVFNTLSFYNVFHLAGRREWALRGFELAVKHNLEEYYGNFALSCAHYLTDSGDYENASHLLDILNSDKLVSVNTVLNKKFSQAYTVWFRGGFDEAVKLLEECLNINNEYNNSKAWETYILSGLSMFLSDPPLDKDVRNIKRAEALVSRALEINTDLYTHAALLNRQALIKTKQGDYMKATELLNESIRLRDTVGNIHGKAISQNSLAMAYSYIGNYDVAMALLQEATTIFRETEDWRHLGHSLHNIGWILVRKGDNEGSQKYLEESLVYRLQLNDSDGHFKTLNQMLKLFISVKNYDKIYDIYEKIEKLYNRYSWLKEEALRTNLLMGDVEFYKRNFGKARQYYEKAEKFLKQNDPLAFPLYFTLAYIHYSLGNVKKYSHYVGLAYIHDRSFRVDFEHISEHIVIAEQMIFEYHHILFI